MNKREIARMSNQNLNSRRPNDIPCPDFSQPDPINKNTEGREILPLSLFVRGRLIPLDENASTDAFAPDLDGLVTNSGEFFFIKTVHNGPHRFTAHDEEWCIFNPQELLVPNKHTLVTYAYDAVKTGCLSNIIVSGRYVENVRNGAGGWGTICTTDRVYEVQRVQEKNSTTGRWAISPTGIAILLQKTE